MLYRSEVASAAELLDEVDRAVLDVEARQWPNTGTKLEAIAATGLSATWHAQRLNALLDDERALAYAPVLVHRLRRLRERARELRADRAA